MRFWKVLVCCLWASASPFCHAGLVTLDFTGEVFSVTGIASPEFSLGSSVTGSITYDTSVVGVPLGRGGTIDPTTVFYNGAIREVQAFVGAFAIALGSGTNRLEVSKSSATLMDRFIAEIFDPAGIDVGGFAPTIFSIGFRDPSGLAFQDTSIPDINQLVSLNNSGFLGFVDTTAANRATFRITSVQEAVAAPATLGLLGLGLLGVRLRRTTSQTT